jgi:hypothetical protein|uniref:Uncharacterized protein n=1 Tax=Desulfobacca acetoxidans TaxID=60893 RepID=A0A7V6A3Z3_9BACT
MDSKEAMSPTRLPLPPKAAQHEDVKSLWERWDKAQSEDQATNLVRGLNLVGLIMIFAGVLLQIFGSGFWKLRLAPIIIVLGALMLAVQKFRALLSHRSLNG